MLMSAYLLVLELHLKMAACKFNYVLYTRSATSFLVNFFKNRVHLHNMQLLKIKAAIFTLYGWRLLKYCNSYKMVN